MPSDHSESSSDYDRLICGLIAGDRDDVMVHLAEAEPAEEARRANWWLGLMETAEMRVHQPRPGQRIEQSAAAWHALAQLGIQRGQIDSERYDRWLANLSAYLYVNAPNECPPELLPSSVVGSVLPRIRQALAHFERIDDWRSLPREEIRQMRQAKNVLTPLVQLADGIEDLTDKEDLRRFAALLRRLP